MQPRGTGSSAKDNEWKRSRYTISGSHYLVYFQLTEAMVNLHCSGGEGTMGIVYFSKIFRHKLICKCFDVFNFKT